jgi:hypothetical protein
MGSQSALLVAKGRRKKEGIRGDDCFGVFASNSSRARMDKTRKVRMKEMGRARMEEVGMVGMVSAMTKLWRVVSIERAPFVLQDTGLYKLPWTVYWIIEP